MFPLPSSRTEMPLNYSVPRPIRIKGYMYVACRVEEAGIHSVSYRGTPNGSDFLTYINVYYSWSMRFAMNEPEIPD